MHCAHVVEFDEHSVEFRVNSRSAHLDLTYFDLCRGALIPDVMHNMLEGVLQYEVKLFLQLSIAKRFFQLSTLNEMIEGIELGYMEDNRSSPITSRVLNSQKGKLAGIILGKR